MKLKEKTPDNNLLKFPWGKREKDKLDQTNSNFGVASLFAGVEQVKVSNNETSFDKPKKEAIKVIINIMGKEDDTKYDSENGDGISDKIDEIEQSRKENTTEFVSVKTKIRKTIQVGQKKEIKLEVISKVLLFIFLLHPPPLHHLLDSLHNHNWQKKDQ